MEGNHSVHLETQHNASAGNLPRIEAELTFLIDVYLTEPVHVARQITLAHAVFTELDEERLSAVAEVIVATFLIARNAPLGCHNLGVTCATSGIVPTPIVFDD